MENLTRHPLTLFSTRPNNMNLLFAIWEMDIGHDDQREESSSI